MRRSALGFGAAAAVSALLGLADVGLLGLTIGFVLVALMRTGPAFVRNERLGRATIRSGTATAMESGFHHGKSATTSLHYQSMSTHVRTVELFGAPAAIEGRVLVAISARSQVVAVLREDGSKVVFARL